MNRQVNFLKIRVFLFLFLLFPLSLFAREISRNFTSSKKIVPYVFAGLGLAYTHLDISDLGSELNGD